MTAFLRALRSRLARYGLAAALGAGGFESGQRIFAPSAPIDVGVTVNIPVEETTYRPPVLPVDETGFRPALGETNL